MDRKKYEEHLRKKQEKHLKRISIRFDEFYEMNWRPCLHDACTECHGTGLKIDGTGCVHYISCLCQKCSPSYLMHTTQIQPKYDSIH